MEQATARIAPRTWILTPDQVNNFLALAFGVFVSALLVFGSIMIMTHLNHNMMSMHELMDMQRLVRRVPAAGFVIRYAMKLARLTRPGTQDGEAPDPNVPDFVKKYVNYGASVRAAQFIVLSAKARA